MCWMCRGVSAEQCTETDAEVARRYACMPGSLERALAAFQREGVRFAISRRGRALLGDEMGGLRHIPPRPTVDLCVGHKALIFFVLQKTPCFCPVLCVRCGVAILTTLF